MSKKDIFWTVIGCVAWAAVIALAVLVVLGILDFKMVFDFFCYVIIGLAIIALLLISILLVLQS